jgi:hypothetical protein
VDFIALLKKKLGEIGTILAGYTSDYCPLKRHAASPSSCLCKTRRITGTGRLFPVSWTWAFLL